jgi:hypothetical protein
VGVLAFQRPRSHLHEPDSRLERDGFPQDMVG